MSEDIDRGDAERERLLIELISGTRSETDPEVQSAFAADSSLRLEWAELRRLANELDGARPTVRDEIGKARAAVTANDRQTAELAVRRELGIPALSRNRWPWYALAVAATLILVLGLTLLRSREQAELPSHLGNRQCLAPLTIAELGANEHRDLFRWRDAPQAGCSYQVRAYDRLAVNAAPVLESGKLEGTTWTPPNDQRDLVRTIRRWELVLDDPDRSEQVVDAIALK